MQPSTPPTYIHALEHVLCRALCGVHDIQCVLMPLKRKAIKRELAGCYLHTSKYSLWLDLLRGGQPQEASARAFSPSLLLAVLDST